MIGMLGTIGLMGCIAAAVCAAVSVACAVATGVTQAVLADKAAKAQDKATKKAESRQRKGQAAQSVSDRKQANAIRQQAAYGIMLARIDTRETEYETEAINKKLVAKSGTSSPTSRVQRGNYHHGTPAA